MKVSTLVFILSLYFVQDVLIQAYEHAKVLGPESIVANNQDEQPDKDNDGDSDFHSRKAGDVNKKLEEASSNNDAISQSDDDSDGDDDEYDYEGGFFGENGKTAQTTTSQATTVATSGSTAETTSGATTEATTQATSETSTVTTEKPNPLPELEVVHEINENKEKDDDDNSLEHSIEEEVLEEEQNEEEKDKNASAMDFTGDVVDSTNNENEAVISVSSSSSSEELEPLPLPDRPLMPDLMPRPHVVFPQIGSPHRPTIVRPNPGQQPWPHHPQWPGIGGQGGFEGQGFGGLGFGGSRFGGFGGSGGFVGFGGPGFGPFFPHGHGQPGQNRPPFGPFGPFGALGQGPFLPGSPIIINNNNNNNNGGEPAEVDSGIGPKPRAQKRKQLVIELGDDSDEENAIVQPRLAQGQFGGPNVHVPLHQNQNGFGGGAGLLSGLFQNIFGGAFGNDGQQGHFPGSQMNGGQRSRFSVDQLHTGQFPGNPSLGGQFQGSNSQASSQLPHPFVGGFFPGGQFPGGQSQHNQYPGGQQPRMPTIGTHPFASSQAQGSQPQNPLANLLPWNQPQGRQSQLQNLFPNNQPRGQQFPNPFAGPGQTGIGQAGSQNQASNSNPRRPNLPGFTNSFANNQGQNQNIPRQNPFANNQGQNQQLQPGQFGNGGMRQLIPGQFGPRVGAGFGVGSVGAGFGVGSGLGTGPGLAAGFVTGAGAGNKNGAGRGSGVGTGAKNQKEEKDEEEN